MAKENAPSAAVFCPAGVEESDPSYPVTDPGVESEL